MAKAVTGNIEMNQKSFLDPDDDSYPKKPGSKEQNGTSQEAADRIAKKATTLRRVVLAELRKKAGTADEIAERIGEHFSNIRPRCSELKAAGVIRKTNQRRRNVRGNTQCVWEAV